MRPRWAKSKLLQGDIAKRLGEYDRAIVAYRRAWQLGDRSVLLADRLLDLLGRTGRWAEADLYITQVTSAVSLSSRLMDHALPMYVEKGRHATALRLARSWVQRRPLDADAHVRLARLLVILGRTESESSAVHYAEGLSEYVAALSRSPNDVEVWLEAVNVLTNLREEKLTLEEALEWLARQSGVSELEKLALSAEVFDAMNRSRQARRCYQRAIKLASAEADPKPPPVCWRSRHYS